MAAIPPPAVADGNANASLIDAYRGGHVNPYTRAGRSSKRLKTAEALHSSNRISEQELGEQEVFHLQQATSALPPGAIPGVPAWFGPAMAAALAPINVTLNNIDGRLNNIEGRLNNTEARQANATVQAQDDPLQPIRNAAGIVAPNFPATLRDLNTLTNAQRSQLLVFYGRAANPAATREQRLKQLVGILP